MQCSKFELQIEKLLCNQACYFEAKYLNDLQYLSSLTILPIMTT